MNPILSKIQDDIFDKISDEDKEDFLNAVKAGKHILYDPSTHQNMELIKNPESRKDPVTTISKGIAGLGYVMWIKSNQQISPDVLIPALIVLMVDVMDFSEQSFNMQFTNEMIAATTKQLIAEIYQKLGVKPADLQAAIQKGKAEIEQHQAGQQEQPPEEPAQPQGMLGAV